MKKFTWSLGILIGAALLGAPGVLGHSTGHESRTVADCEKLPGTKEAGERGQCLKCVARPMKHHYHPDNPPGDRCRPDNGKP